MTIRYLFVAVLFSMAAVFWACSDDDSSVEFRVEREVSDISTLLQCAKGADSGAYCFMVRFRYPDDTESLDSIYLCRIDPEGEDPLYCSITFYKRFLNKLGSVICARIIDGFTKKV